MRDDFGAQPVMAGREPRTAAMPGRARDLPLIRYRATAAAVSAVAVLLLTCGKEKSRDLAEPPARTAAIAAETRQPSVPPADQYPGMDRASSRFVDSLLQSAAGVSGLAARTAFFCRALLDFPYDSTSPTGEGPEGTVDSAPLFNFGAYDCVTYIEHALALALARAPRDVLPRLTAIRYRDGVVDYTARNHFFIADWMTANGGLLTVVDPPAGYRTTRIVSRRAFFKRKGISVDRPDTVLKLMLWTVPELSAAVAGNTPGDGVYIVAFLKKGWKYIDANHTGILEISGGRALLFEASRMRGSTIALDAAAYLKGQEAFLEGMVVARVKG